MDFKEYQRRAVMTAIYPGNLSIMYPALGLAGECGEICNKVKKIFRDKQGLLNENDQAKLAHELGDVLWYLAVLANDLGIDLDEIARENLLKLMDRKERGTIQGDGDSR